MGSNRSPTNRRCDGTRARASSGRDVLGRGARAVHVRPRGGFRALGESRGRRGGARLGGFLLSGFGLDLADARPGWWAGWTTPWTWRAASSSCASSSRRARRRARACSAARPRTRRPTQSRIVGIVRSDSDTSSPREETDASARRAIGAAAAATRDDVAAFRVADGGRRGAKAIDRVARVERPGRAGWIVSTNRPGSAVLARARRIRDSSGNRAFETEAPMKLGRLDRSRRCTRSVAPFRPGEDARGHVGRNRRFTAENAKSYGRQS